MALEKFLIDTDVLIDYLRGVSQAIEYLRAVQEKHTCYISTITIAELFSGVREDKERQVLTDFYKEFHVAAVGGVLTEKAGLLRRDYGKSHGSGLADCIIAATAEELDCTLVTLNKKHFPMIKKVKVPYKK